MCRASQSGDKIITLITSFRQSKRPIKGTILFKFEKIEKVALKTEIKLIVKAYCERRICSAGWTTDDA